MDTSKKNKIKVINIIWAFGTGGIAQLFKTYATLGDFDTDLSVTSVCIDLINCDYDRRPLRQLGITTIPINSRHDFSWVKRLGIIADKLKPDVVFCHGFNGPIIALIASLFYSSLRIPMICTYHGLYNPPTPQRKPLARLINFIQAWTYKRHASKVILVSKYSGRFLIDHGVPADKLFVIYNGIPENVSSSENLHLPKDIVSIGVVGRLDSIKGINYLIDALPIIKAKYGNGFHLYIVGDGPEEENLRNQVISLNLDSFVSFVGYQSNIQTWLNSWDIFCLPSLQENHSIALLEAMRAGKAIVCTSVGGNPETLEDGIEGIIVEPMNSKDLADGLLKLMADSRLRNLFGNNAYKHFKTAFTVQTMKKKLCDTIKASFIIQ